MSQCLRTASFALLFVSHSLFAQTSLSWVFTVERGILFHQQSSPQYEIYPIDSKYAVLFVREGLRDMVSLIVEPDARQGLGWYGVLGVLERNRFGSVCDLVNIHQNRCVLSHETQENRHPTQKYAGGGLRYRFLLAEPLSVTALFGVTHVSGQDRNQFPRDHLYHMGIRLEYALSRSWAITGGYTHMSNGGPRLPGGGNPNRGIDRPALGIQYRF